MIAIGHVLLSDEVVEKHFVCDLQSCRGGCCVDGDCGAPLAEEEARLLPEIYGKVKPFLPAAYSAEIEKQGFYVWDDEFGYVTPTVNGGICAYGYTDDLGIVKCGIERAWKEGKIGFRKPISCHLYPIRIKEGDGYEMVNYQPRRRMCSPACRLGDELRIPVYRFLRDSLVRKYGEDFYETLEAVAQKMDADRRPA